MYRLEQIEPVVADLSLKPFSAVAPRVGHPRGRVPQPAVGQQAAQEHRGAPVLRGTSCSSPTGSSACCPTIVSRCQVVEFRPLSDTEVSAYLRRAATTWSRPRRRRSPASRAARSRGPRVLADDAAGPGLPRASTSSTRRGSRRRTARRTGPAPGRGVPRRAGPAAGGDRGAGRGGPRAPRRRARAASSRTRRTSSGTRSRPRRAPSAKPTRRGRLAAQDALDLLVAWVRDLWVCASGASDVLWNSDHRDALAEAVAATPEHYAAAARPSPPRLARTCISTSTRSSRCRRCSRASRRSPPVPRICSVVFRGGGRVYQFGAGDLELASGRRRRRRHHARQRLRPRRQGARGGRRRRRSARPPPRRPQGVGRRPRGHGLAP